MDRRWCRKHTGSRLSRSVRPPCRHHTTWWTLQWSKRTAQSGIAHRGYRPRSTRRCAPLASRVLRPRSTHPGACTTAPSAHDHGRDVGLRQTDRRAPRAADRRAGPSRRQERPARHAPRVDDDGDLGTARAAARPAPTGRAALDEAVQRERREERVPLDGVTRRALGHGFGEPGCDLGRQPVRELEAAEGIELAPELVHARHRVDLRPVPAVAALPLEAIEPGLVVEVPPLGPKAACELLR